MAIKKVNEKWEQTVDELIDELARPTYVLRMARGFEHEDSARGRSCRTRARNARIDIQQTVRDLAWK